MATPGHNQANNTVRRLQASGNMHLKPRHGQAYHTHAQDGHGGDLGPKRERLLKNSINLKAY
jgi:hypothetical protein